MSASALSTPESWVEPQSGKNSDTHILFGGRFRNKVVSLKHIGMTYINVGEMCFIPMNVHNELFNGVRQFRWQHLSPAVSTLFFYIYQAPFS